MISENEWNKGSFYSIDKLFELSFHI